MLRGSRCMRKQQGSISICTEHNTPSAYLNVQKHGITSKQTEKQITNCVFGGKNCR
jgi:hypothetical protein